MNDILIRIEGRAGRITFTRPKALNALTAQMSGAIEAALGEWRDHADVDLVLVDATGDKAFCAGGDIAELYSEGTSGNHAFGQGFWRQEYRLNLMMAQYPKPIVTFMQGFTMGGGVGVGCHASHRIVGETSRIAMPECGIGLVPDVGGSRILGRAPGGIGAYLGLTGTRMGPMDAIHIGFADWYVPLDHWESLKKELIETGSPEAIQAFNRPVEQSPLAAEFETFSDCFDADNVAGIAACLEQNQSEAAQKALKGLKRGAPISLACALVMIRRARDLTLHDALAMEYRFSYRAQEQGDFLEGIRAQIIDRDFTPNWRHPGFDVPEAEVDAMLAPLGDEEWNG